jgi:histone H4
MFQVCSLTLLFVSRILPPPPPHERYAQGIEFLAFYSNSAGRSGGASCHVIDMLPLRAIDSVLLQTFAHSHTSASLQLATPRSLKMSKAGKAASVASQTHPSAEKAKAKASEVVSAIHSLKPTAYKPKRHRKMLSAGTQYYASRALTPPAVRRLARRGGIKRIAALSNSETREVLVEYLKKILQHATTLADYQKHKTITVQDIIKSIQVATGKAYYGNGQHAQGYHEPKAPVRTVKPSKEFLRMVTEPDTPKDLDDETPAEEEETDGNTLHQPETEAEPMQVDEQEEAEEEEEEAPTPAPVKPAAKKTAAKAKEGAPEPPKELPKAAAKKTGGRAAKKLEVRDEEPDE